MENREMFEEINALIGAVAKAFDLAEMEVVKAIEAGELGMSMVTDDQGRNCVEVGFDGRTARIYQGAIFRPDDTPEPEDDECGGDKGHGGCSCGH
ncbi:hypothetical protein A6A04_04360 [Paramagnetospirillum marisnigri]|uniref:Uncharacterized protein n=1 Tax=Paramagnetospirillum marisnigri TaxID=1285242 RepID=A0A178MIJ9_9PROT|nr:hypothetical protein [Paramagnetospirillum marisnigri]OAN47997.1 hypothetical protein A6A04_04360 [Paramagnetospirillum marisnigri]